MRLEQLPESIKEDIRQLLLQADVYGDGITMDFEKSCMNVYSEAGQVCVPVHMNILKKVFDILEKNKVWL